MLNIFFFILCIQDDTSGDYCEILLALTGDRPAPEISAEDLAEANEPQEIEEVEEEVIPVRISHPLCQLLRAHFQG